MSLSADQITLVKSSFAKIASEVDAVAGLFYGRLFTLDPSLKSMFKADITEQGRKLMQIIAFAVHSLGDLNALVPHVQALGQRHITYGVTPDHYVTVGDALIWTLRQGLRDDFTPEVEDAWIAVYTLLVATATENVYSAQPL